MTDKEPTEGATVVNGYTIEPVADLRYVDLRYVDLRDADLRGADLSHADLVDAKVSNDADAHTALLEALGVVIDGVQP